MPNAQLQRRSFLSTTVRAGIAVVTVPFPQLAAQQREIAASGAMADNETWSEPGGTALMSLFQGVRHDGSSPDRLGSTSLAGDRAWQGAALKTTVEQTCMGLSVSSARHRRSALVAGSAVRPRIGGWVTIGGELAIAGRRSSRRKLVCGRPAWGQTMMQPCASAAKLRGDGPIL